MISRPVHKRQMRPIATHNMAVPGPSSRSKPNPANTLVAFVFYAFVFSAAFESIDMGIGNNTIAKYIGYLMVALALVYPHRCFGKLPYALFAFSAYFFAYVLLAMQFLSDPSIRAGVIATGFTILQLLGLLVISYNLLLNEQIAKRSVWMLVLSAVALSLAQLGGVAARTVGNSRLTVLNQNPNILASVLSIGLLALVGLGFGREKSDRKARILSCLGVLPAIGIALSGSRGGVLALIAGLLASSLKKSHAPAGKARIALIVVAVVAIIAVASFEVGAIRERWENTLSTGDMAGREQILPQAWGMFLERPLWGWGPVKHLYELGSRLGLVTRDPHNTYIWVLNETGLLGGIPFLAGILICLRAAWRARDRGQGTMPLALLVCALVVGLKGTNHMEKLFWVLIAYSLTNVKHKALRPEKSYVFRSSLKHPRLVNTWIGKARANRATNP